MRQGAFVAAIGEIAHELVDPSGPDAAATAEAFQTMALRLGSDAFVVQTEALVTRDDLRPALVPTVLFELSCKF